MSAALLSVAAALVLVPGPVRPLRRLSARPGRPLADLLRRPAASPWAAAAVVGVVGAVLSTPLVAALAAGCSALGSRALQARRRGAAADARLLGLAEALGVLSAELRAGRPLPAAASSAAAACPDAQAGRDLARALVGGGPLTSGDPELVAVASTVELSLRTGCSLAAVAASLEDDLRARHRHRLELRTATAGPRASAVVLAGLPAVGLAMGAGIGADPWRVLTATGPGQVLLVAGVLLEVAGVAWVGRLTRRVVSGPVPGGPRG